VVSVNGGALVPGASASATLRSSSKPTDVTPNVFAATPPMQARQDRQAAHPGGPLHRRGQAATLLLRRGKGHRPFF
jgi:hypothetical protein